MMCRSAQFVPVDKAMMCTRHAAQEQRGTVGTHRSAPTPRSRTSAAAHSRPRASPSARSASPRWRRSSSCPNALLPFRLWKPRKPSLHSLPPGAHARLGLPRVWKLIARRVELGLGVRVGVRHGHAGPGRAGRNRAGREVAALDLEPRPVLPFEGDRARERDRALPEAVLGQRRGERTKAILVTALRKPASDSDARARAACAASGWRGGIGDE